MPDKVFNVRFICPHNSARSILAEGLMNSAGRGAFQAFSAGSQPSGQVHPMALATLAKLHLPTDGCRSKSWSEFAAPGAPQMDFVFTVCDNAAGEECHVWPGQPVTAHWGVPDPSAARQSAAWDSSSVASPSGWAWASSRASAWACGCRACSRPWPGWSLPTSTWWWRCSSG